ncbi:MAG TPA: RNA polymerase sigma factor [Bacteroidia bacterium]|nr:RNA polymerase sigma factor [Bacteroidia bacterium]HNT81106.1 RNA polymerase sigma factor [Bacteroidia bacterium]
MNEEQLLQECIQGSRQAQKELYERFSRLMMGVCLRYSDSREMAEDVLHDGFLKVFEKINTYRGEGSLEGWIRRIMINTAMNSFRRQKLEPIAVEELPESNGTEMNTNALTHLSAKELIGIIQSMPLGYRSVFNLFAIEGYSHKEISEMLNISEGTSKSQYSRAKMHLQRIIEKELIENER